MFCAKVAISTLDLINLIQLSRLIYFEVHNSISVNIECGIHCGTFQSSLLYHI